MIGFKKTLLCLFIVLVSYSSFALDNKDFKVAFCLTDLLAFQKENNEYVYQGPPPGVYIKGIVENVFINNDSIKYDPAIYYMGIGFITDQTIQYGYKFDYGISPSIGFGINLGDINDEFTYNLYLPISLSIDVLKSNKWDIELWGQIQNYFRTQNGSTYWLGGKIAVDIEYKIDQKNGILIQPILGGGGTQILTGMRIGYIVRSN